MLRLPALIATWSGQLGGTDFVETLTKLFEAKGMRMPEGLDRKQMLVTEFFTGMMPLINYVVYREECAGTLVWMRMNSGDYSSGRLR